MTAEQLRAAPIETAVPIVSPEAVTGLKFSAALPEAVAAATLAERNTDRAGAAEVSRSAIVVRSGE